MVVYTTIILRATFGGPSSRARQNHVMVYY